MRATRIEVDAFTINPDFLATLWLCGVGIDEKRECHGRD
jgi:hypothetical protein